MKGIIEIYPETELDFTALKKAVKERFALKTKMVTVEYSFQRADMPTRSQYRYYFGIVLPIVVLALRHIGYLCQNENEADTYLKEFTGEYKELVNIRTGQTIKRYNSKADMNIERVSYLIDYAIKEVCEPNGFFVPPPPNKEKSI